MRLMRSMRRSSGFDSLGVPSTVKLISIRSSSVPSGYHSAVEPQPNQLPLLHPMEERAGGEEARGFLDSPSPRSSPHSFVVGRGRKSAHAEKTFVHSGRQMQEGCEAAEGN